MRGEKANTAILHDQSNAAASELNNLLHIIGGTTSLIENIWQDSPSADKYMRMLRNSVDRAASVTTQLLGHISAQNQKTAIHPADRERPILQVVAEMPGPLPRSVRRVLVVDDEPMALELAEDLLSDRGFDVTTAQSGFECLSILAAAPDAYGVVVLDLSMPFMDGEEVFDRVHATHPGMSVLLNTGFVSRDVAERMFARGLSALLTKPTSPEKYVDTISSLLANSDAQTAKSISTIHPHGHC